MSQRLTRKEMKHDEFASAVGKSVEYAESHTKGLLTIIGAVLLAVALGIVVYYYLGHRAAVANEALRQAMKVYDAPVEATGAKPDDPLTPSFPTVEARRTKAKQLFERLRSDHRFTGAADLAGVYLAEFAVAEGRPEEARQLWTDFTKKHRDHLLAGQARLNLIALDRNQGKAQQVERELRAMLDQSEAPLPQDAVLYELGVTLEQLKRTPDAVQSYQRIVDEFPRSPYRSLAQQRVGQLDPTRSGGASGLFGGAGGGFPGA